MAFAPNKRWSLWESGRCVSPVRKKERCGLQDTKLPGEHSTSKAWRAMQCYGLPRTVPIRVCWRLAGACSLQRNIPPILKIAIEIYSSLLVFWYQWDYLGSPAKNLSFFAGYLKLALWKNIMVDRLLEGSILLVMNGDIFRLWSPTVGKPIHQPV